MSTKGVMRRLLPPFISPCQSDFCYIIIYTKKQNNIRGDGQILWKDHTYRQFKCIVCWPCCCGYYFHLSSTIRQPKEVVMVFQVTYCVQLTLNSSTHLQNPGEHSYKQSYPWQMQTLYTVSHQHQQDSSTPGPLVGNFHKVAVVLHLYPKYTYRGVSFRCMG